MSKVYGIPVAAAFAVLVSMACPTLALANVCGDKTDLCDRGNRADTPKPDFTPNSKDEEPEDQEQQGKQAPEAEARTR